MKSTDPQQQWRELRETYGQMTEDELCAVAEDARDLTQVAKDALQTEIAGRGLDIHLKTVDAPDVDTLDVDPIEDVEEDLNAVHCPKCKSPEVVFEGKDPEPPDRLGVDTPFNWSCDACGYQWKDDGIEE